jgi:beta-lactamase class A
MAPVQQTITHSLASLDAGCTGRLGVSARDLRTGQGVNWRADERFRTASTVKVAIMAAVLDRAGGGSIDLDRRVEVRVTDLVGGSGVLSVLRPGLRPTVADLMTLMIVVSDNTATNLLIDLVGGVEAVNQTVTALGFGEIVLGQRLGYTPPPLVAGPQPAPAGPAGTLATATPAALSRLVEAVRAGQVVNSHASKLIFDTMAHQQYHSGVPRAWVDLTGPDGTPPGWPTVASKTGSVPGCRAEVGVLGLPDGTEVVYAVMADDLADTTMTALSEGDELLGKVGAVLVRWAWQGPGPAPVRPGWP